jgi:hypothetical protein
VVGECNNPWDVPLHGDSRCSHGLWSHTGHQNERDPGAQSATPSCVSASLFRVAGDVVRLDAP